MKISAVIKTFAAISIASCFCAFAADPNSIVKPVAPKSADNIIELKITKHTANGVEARIVNLSEDAKKMNLEKVSVIGTKVQHESIKGAKPFTEIMWSKAAVDNKTTELPSSFRSKVVANPNLNVGDKFKAKGDEKVLIETLEKMMNKDASKPNHLVRSTKSGSNTSSSSADASLTSTNNTSKLSTLSSVRQNAASIGSTTTGDLGTEVTSTTGCAARVDYQLNKVFIQERTTMGGKETQSCHDSATSFTLQKDYLACPKTINTATGKVVPNFQYFYLDADKGTNAIDSCQPDNTKATSLAITKSYDCTDYVDLNSKTAYSQFKQSYKDSDNKDVLLTDCAIDSSKSYQVIEDFASCGIRDLFDMGYSIQQSRLYYTKDGIVMVSVQSCQDTTKKFTHSSTSDTCTPVINNNQVTTFSRNYITVDGIRQYISECTPLNSNVTIKSENCTTTPYTHDFVAGQSFRNKNYFYLDQNNNRVEVSTCVKSDETFAMSEDSSVCTEESDDINMRTTVYSKKYIVVDGNKIFISSCAAVSPTVPYKEIGYKWISEYNLGSTSISAGGVSDNTYLGSKQGVEQNTSNYNIQPGYWTQLVNQFNISNYSTTGKCTSATSISYNGNAVDIAFSNQASLSYDNYVDQISSSPMCVKYCYEWSVIKKYCSSGLSSVCQSTNNTLYYQRCTNYKCPIYKYVRKPIMQRKNGTEIINTARTLENKYTCGDGGLNGSAIYY